MYIGTVSAVAIFKPDGTALFEVGNKLMRGETVTDETVIKIIIIFNTVMIKLSSGQTITFIGCPMTFQK